MSKEEFQFSGLKASKKRIFIKDGTNRFSETDMNEALSRLKRGFTE